MEIKGRLKHTFKEMQAPQIPDSWSELLTEAINGGVPEISAYGRLEGSRIDYYGAGSDGIKKGRIIIPMGNFETSYHISQNPDGSMVIKEEGLFPSSD